MAAADRAPAGSRAPWLAVLARNERTGVPDDNDMKLTLALPEGDFEFDPNIHLTRSILAHVKGWYGRTDLWQSFPFRVALGSGEPNAAAVAIWIAKRAQGITPNPAPIDFARKFGDPADFPVGRVILAPNRPEGAVSPRWMLRPEEGEEYDLSLDDEVMCSHLRQIQKWYPHIPTYLALYNGLIMGDPDAVACAIWICRLSENLRRQAAGDDLIPNPNPRDMDDFSVMKVSPWENHERLNDEGSYEVNPTMIPASKSGDGNSDQPSQEETGQQSSYSETPTSSGENGSPL